MSFLGEHLPKGHLSLSMQDAVKKDPSPPTPMEECLGTKSLPSPGEQAPSRELHLMQTPYPNTQERTLTQGPSRS